jgi:hypothetical protein
MFGVSGSGSAGAELGIQDRTATMQVYDTAEWFTGRLYW